MYVQMGEGLISFKSVQFFEYQHGQNNKQGTPLKKLTTVSP